ncbi:MAG: hypothetical protein GOVbin1709_75 [Prokaryotic dsDNA virus sp.]|nr:MAG: hypothetical protein GOVbin1709_75 [Prokaryotic dsDNA virus sp.]|tara:strand:- start:21122 stop:25258 length:4137 start_codon:yes stop_codon:yes gene_type:complete
MACRLIIKAKNGKDSKLFNDLNDIFGEEYAKNLYALANTDIFKTWLANKYESPDFSYKYDNNGEIEYRAILEFSESYDTTPISMARESSKNTTRKINLLKQTFRNVGINVSIIEDYDIVGRAQVDPATDENQAVIRLNPDKVFKDTIIHEFGHIYVDLLGEDHPLVIAGINQLKNTELWKQVEAAYPHLTPNKLAKEVLVTAIGREGAEIFDTQRDQSRFQRVLNAIFSAISRVLGLNSSNIAKRLATEMLNQNLQRNLSGKLSDYTQHSINVEEGLNQKELNKYLSNKIGNLHKQIRKFKSIAPEFSESLKDIVDEIQKADTHEQLEKLNTYISSTLGRVIQIEDDNGNVVERATGIEGRLIEVENMLDEIDRLKNAVAVKELNGKQLSQEDINRLEEDIKVKLMSVIRSLYHANVMVDSFNDISDLDDRAEYPPVIKKAIRSLQDNIGKIAKLRARSIRLGKRAFITQLKEYTSNKEILDNAENIFENNFDESGTQRWMDALADTNHSFIALVRKRVAEELDKKRLDVIRLKREWEDEVKILKQNGIKLEDFFEEVDGIKTGRFIQEYDEAEFYRLKSEMFDRYFSLMNRANALAKGTKERSELLKEAKKLIRDFYQENTQPIENWQQIVEAKKAKLSPERFEQWLKDNFYSGRGGRLYPRGKEVVEMKKEKFRNPKFDILMSDPVKKRFYEYYQRLINELTAHSNNDFLRRGFLPAVPLDQRNYIQALRDNVGWRTLQEEQEEFQEDEAKEVLVDETGKVINFIPFYYMTKLDQLDLKDINNESLTNEEIEERIKENKKIREENKRRHAERLDFNLEKTMPRFIDTALNHRAKTAMEEEVLFAREILTHTQIRKKTGSILGRGKRVIDKTFKQDMNEDRDATDDASESNILKHFDDWIQMVFYEKFEEDEGAWTKASRVLQNWASLRGIGWNVFSGINNKMYGFMQTHIEAAGSQFFGYSEYRKASSDYYANIHEYLMEGITSSVKGEESNVFSSNSKAGGLMVMFDILQSQDELAEQAGGPERSKLHKFKFFTDSAYAMQHIGEHSMQNITMLAMLRRYKVDPSNGKIYRNSEAYARKNGLSYNTPEEKADIQKKFKELESVYDVYELVDGYTQLKKGRFISDKEWSEFRQEIIGVNQYMHGIYNKEDAGAMQKYGLARLAIQFRKWARPGWNRRWGSKFGQSYWNERRNMLDEGMYVTTAKFTWQLLKDYRNFFSNSKLNWDSLDETQKANVKRSAMELLLLISVILFTQMLKGMEEEDDDLKESKAFNILMYQSDRLWTEIATYSPVYGWFNEASKLMQSPTASWNMVEDVYKLAYNTFAYPFRTEKERIFKSGVNYGDDKINTYLRKSVPLYNQVGRWNRLEKHNKFYKLF